MNNMNKEMEMLVRKLELKLMSLLVGDEALYREIPPEEYQSLYLYSFATAVYNKERIKRLEIYHTLEKYRSPDGYLCVKELFEEVPIPPEKSPEICDLLDIYQRVTYL